MTKHDNIYKTENNKYAVRIQRRIDGKRFAISENYLTLEEAIAARDTILRNFRASGKLQHSKDRRARCLARAIKRLGTDDIVEIKANDVSDRTVFVKRAECEICGSDISRSHYLGDSTTKCRKCITDKDSDHQRRMQQSRIDRVESNKNNSIGVKNISYNRHRQRYHVEVCRNGERFRALAVTLEEAIRIKEIALEFYKTHGHVPDAYDLN